MDDRVQISELIYKSFLTLDDLNFEGFIALCDPHYNYKITAYSPEIRKEMIWLEESRDSLKLLFDNLPKHNSDHSRLARLGNVYLVNKTGAHEWDGAQFGVVKRPSTSPLQNIITAACRRLSPIFVRFFVSISPAKLNDRSTAALVVG